MGDTNREKIGELLDRVEDKSTGRHSKHSPRENPQGEVKAGIRDDAEQAGKLLEQYAVHDFSREPSLLRGVTTIDGLRETWKRVSLLTTLIEGGEYEDTCLTGVEDYLRTYFNIQPGKPGGYTFKLAGSILYTYKIPFAIAPAETKKGRTEDLFLIGVDSTEYNLNRFESRFNGGNPDRYELTSVTYYPIEGQGRLIDGLNTGRLLPSAKITGPALAYDGDQLSAQRSLGTQPSHSENAVRS